MAIAGFLECALNWGVGRPRLAHNIMPKRAKEKGRKGRKGRGGALSSCDGLCGGLCGGSGQYASACCWLIALSGEAINQLPIASVYGPQDY